MNPLPFGFQVPCDPGGVPYLPSLKNGGAGNVVVVGSGAQLPEEVAVTGGNQGMASGGVKRRWANDDATRSGNANAVGGTGAFGLAMMGQTTQQLPEDEQPFVVPGFVATSATAASHPRDTNPSDGHPTASGPSLHIMASPPGMSNMPFLLGQNDLGWLMTGRSGGLEQLGPLDVGPLTPSSALHLSQALNFTPFANASSPRLPPSASAFELVQCEGGVGEQEQEQPQEGKFERGNARMDAEITDLDMDMVDYEDSRDSQASFQSDVSRSMSATGGGGGEGRKKAAAKKKATSRKAPARPSSGGQRKRMDWSKGEPAERMRQAIEECKAITDSGVGSWRAVARKYDISWAVLYPRLSGKVAVDASLGAKSMLPREIEEKIYRHCCEMADKGMGLDWADVKPLAVKIASTAGIPRFKATDGWVRQFQHRFPQLKRTKVTRTDSYSESVNSPNKGPRRCFVLCNAGGGQGEAQAGDSHLDNGPATADTQVDESQPFFDDAAAEFGEMEDEKEGEGEEEGTGALGGGDEHSRGYTVGMASHTTSRAESPAPSAFGKDEEGAAGQERQCLPSMPLPTASFNLGRGLASGARMNEALRGLMAHPHLLQQHQGGGVLAPPGFESADSLPALSIPEPGDDGDSNITAADLMPLVSDDQGDGLAGPSWRPDPGMHVNRGQSFDSVSVEGSVTSADGFGPNGSVVPVKRRVQLAKQRAATIQGGQAMRKNRPLSRELERVDQLLQQEAQRAQTEALQRQTNEEAGIKQEQEPQAQQQQQTQRRRQDEAPPLPPRRRRQLPEEQPAVRAEEGGAGGEGEEQGRGRSLPPRKRGRLLLNPEQPVVDLLVEMGVVPASTAKPSLASMKAFMDRFHLKLPRSRTKVRT
jgi:hypothetical protein